MRELRIQKNSKKSGSGVNDVYETKLWCFDQISFLEGHVATRQSQDNTEMPSSSNSSYFSTGNSTETGSSSVNDEPLKKRKKKSNQFADVQQELSVFRSMIENKEQNGRKYAWLGALVSNQMDEIDPDKQQDAAWEIQSVIKKYIEESQQKRSTPTSNRTSSSSDKDLLQLSMEGVLTEKIFANKILKHQKK
ncbi:uncharacterized protein LOC129236005 [Anastrepha obliqua]|uniref:uncharacterized protein LOC129236005 n=1 Tax=Anastrepha obliqua TaxID=95512 RepID=UPI0024097804|nr:uncharacterized protein LOC129236005 [Anastrepha obliqua]